MTKLERVEKYEVVEEIGLGGMATVYRATDTRLKRPVALKVMHPHLQGAPEARTRFAREATTVARLKHSGILEIYDYSGEDSDVSFIATELLTGPNLREFADEHQEIPPELAACMVMPVAYALEAAHSEGVIHRDVKPENIMLHEARSVKLTDFGIAQLLDASSMTTTGQVLGSPGHMAPEQIEGGECDARTDLFSLGTVLYMLATGRLPFEGKNPHQVLKQIVDGRFTDPLQVRPEIGGQLSRIIKRCLQVEADKRYPSGGELAGDLEAFVAQMGIDDPSATLAEYLGNPEEFVPAFRTRAIERLVTLGEKAQRGGDRMLALDHFNRVLAMDEGNARVLEALRRMGRSSALKKVAGVAAGVALVLGLAWMDKQRASTASVDPSGSLESAVAASPQGEGSEALTSVDPNAGMEDPKPTDDPAKDPNVPAAKPSKKPKAPVRPLGKGPRTVVFKPYPANVSISIDGAAPKAFGPSFRQAQLAPGTHRFKFIGAHDCCLDKELTMRIPPGPGATTVAQRLEFRPAGLYVVSNTPSNVHVDGGRVSGRTRSVIKVPHRRAMRETHKIRVSAEGFKDHTKEVALKAGQVETIKVTMRPAG